MAVMICLAENKDRNMTVTDVAKKLGVSKIYLEQVFSQLKSSGLVQSVKGAQGGYFPVADAAEISAYDILKATESSLFERADSGGGLKAEYIESALNELLWEPLDGKLCEFLRSVTLKNLLDHFAGKNIMFYI